MSANDTSKLVGAAKTFADAKRHPDPEPAIEWALRTRPTAAYSFLRAYYRTNRKEDRELKLAWDCLATALGVEVDK